MAGLIRDNIMTTTSLTDFDIHLWNEGTHYHAYRKLGAHPEKRDGTLGTRFAVWAPNADQVSVIGDFNAWSATKGALYPVGTSGIWEGFLPKVGHGDLYKYAVRDSRTGFAGEKTDPFGFAAEIRPQTASKVWDLRGYRWGDQEWLQHRGSAQALGAPISIYEVHLGSWRRVPHSNGWLSYNDLALQLADYCHEMGFTHVELLPITEHPLDASWGYQTVGYYAPTSRFGTPHDFMHFVDILHQKSIGVLLDWVPAHFPRDAHGLARFDGTHLYEHADPKQGFQPDWGTLVFNYGRLEIRNFLISNATFWLDKYHVDGLRVDAVASMLYLDYSRKAGEWTPNKYGGRENLDAIAFMGKLNEQVYAEFPGVLMVAEESTAWPQVSRPTYVGGLGFGYKWDMGWMHDTLNYLALDPVHRKYHHNNLTFRGIYAFTENYVLPLSHDEVVHGKGSLLGRMPGDDWQRFANLRLLLGWMYAQPGKKLLFMGGEFGQCSEWNHDSSLDWHLLDEKLHKGLQRWVRDLNTAYRAEPALHELDCYSAGFEWVDANDADNSLVTFLRSGRQGSSEILVVCNFTPVPRRDYLIGVPKGGHWQEILNSDAGHYGGSGQGNLGGMDASAVPHYAQPNTLNINVPPLAMVVFKRSD